MKTICKLIDYAFQNIDQLVSAYDDSNTMRGLNENLNCIVVGRYGIHVTFHKVNGYKVIFLPTRWDPSAVADFILYTLMPDVIHMHGNHSWPSYPYYAKRFVNKCKLIFSPAGSSCGTPEFLDMFDYIIVNHPMQRIRMKTDDLYKILVRHRAANHEIFYPKYQTMKYDFVYVAGFVPVKQIPIMIDTFMEATPDKTLVILGDFTRTAEHYKSIETYIDRKGIGISVILHDFIPQAEMSNFLGKCGVFVWPNIRPENPSTTTNRATTEAVACGMPLLLGARAFVGTDYVRSGFNGFLYNNPKDFRFYSDVIFRKIDSFRYNSTIVCSNLFDYRRNFIDFYNELYGK